MPRAGARQSVPPGRRFRRRDATGERGLRHRGKFIGPAHPVPQLAWKSPSTPNYDPCRHTWQAVAPSQRSVISFRFCKLPPRNLQRPPSELHVTAVQLPVLSVIPVFALVMPWYLRQQSIGDYSRLLDAFVERALCICKIHERRIYRSQPDLHNHVRKQKNFTRGPC